MRAFRISLVLFALMIALIVVGTWVGRCVCDKLQCMTEALPETPGEYSAAQAVVLRDYWQRQLPRLRPIVSRIFLRTVSDLVNDLTAYASPDADSVGDYRAARAELLEAIDEMRRAERAAFGLGV